VSRPDPDVGIVYLIVCAAILVVFMIWMYNQPY
jgi:hypothetical protein